MKSTHSILIVAIVWLIFGVGYYPKWEKQLSEATISWDVSGYYHYLPAMFIYNDIRQQRWMEQINQQYLPSPAFDQAFDHLRSGNKVNKYAIGQALMFSPFFLSAHAYASVTDSYPADGYSRPYQVAIWLGGLLFSILGLILLREILLNYFNDQIVLWTVLALGLGTHWMEYASISNGMNHTWLFTLLCGLIYCTIQFNKNADWKSAIGIGVFLGLSVLTRPTEIIWVLIPICWGMVSIRDRSSFLWQHWRKCSIAVIICGVMMSLQMIYWKYAAGEWIMYSYAGQGFNWFHPKIWRGLMGVNLGWWTYTPLMLLAMWGWHGLYKKHKEIFWPVFVTCMLAIYITLSWAHWEEGGGLGQRNLIQMYPLMAFPLAMVIQKLTAGRIGKWVWIGLLALSIYYSGWWTHQAHQGGLFVAGQMTTPYFYSVAGRLHPDRDLLKLLDTREYFKGSPRQSRVVLENDFENDSVFCSSPWPKGGLSTCLNKEVQFLGPISISLSPECKSWIRLEADFIMQSREWELWKYAQWILQFYQGDEVIKSNLIRVHRLLQVEQTATHIYFDVRVPDNHFDRCVMTLWNGGSQESLLIDNLKISCFEE